MSLLKLTLSATLTDGKGFVLISDPQQYGLPKDTFPGRSGHDHFGTSMFHQLHCLGMIRYAYHDALKLGAASAEGPDPSRPHEKHDKRSSDGFMGHIAHCFDYIRQGIMCAGDLSLEWGHPSEEGSTRRIFDGWDIPHQCRSWDQAVEWVGIHQAPRNYSGIL